MKPTKLFEFKYLINNTTCVKQVVFNDLAIEENAKGLHMHIGENVYVSTVLKKESSLPLITIQPIDAIVIARVME